ncbi:Hypothetical protein mma_2654 [Janthinobacterium sp. Marseille]|nr:Hypothetical protein mma_2654 [Janthinobacterium sp. Marseille]
MHTHVRSANGDRRNKGPDQFLCGVAALPDIARNASIVHFFRPSAALSRDARRHSTVSLHSHPTR